MDRRKERNCHLAIRLPWYGKTWVDRILDNENHEVDKNKIIGLIDEWIAWLQETRLKIMKMKDIDPTQIKEKE